MRPLIIVFLLSASILCPMAATACPFFEQELEQLKVLEELVDLSRPVDRRGRYFIVEHDESGKEISRLYENKITPEYPHESKYVDKNGNKWIHLNQESPEQRHLLMKYHFFKNLKLKADPKTAGFIYTTPAKVEEAVSSLNLILSDPFIADMKLIDRSEVKDFVQFIWPLFSKLWKLDEGPIATELKEKGMIGEENMVNHILELYWDSLHHCLCK